MATWYQVIPMCPFFLNVSSVLLSCLLQMQEAVATIKLLSGLVGAVSPLSQFIAFLLLFYPFLWRPLVQTAPLEDSLLVLWVWFIQAQLSLDTLERMETCSLSGDRFHIWAPLQWQSFPFAWLGVVHAPEWVWCIWSFYHWAPRRKVMLCAPMLPVGSCSQHSDPPWAFSEQSHLFQHHFIQEMLQSLNHLHYPFLNLLQYVFRNEETTTRTPDIASPVLNKEGSPLSICCLCQQALMEWSVVTVLVNS